MVVFVRMINKKLNSYLGYCCMIALACIVLVGCSKDSDSNDPDPNPGSGINKEDNLKPTGDSANDLLSASSFDKIQVEILHVPGQAPTSASVNNLRNFIGTYLNKPGGVTVDLKEINITAQNQYSLTDITRIEDEQRTLYNSGKTIAVSALFLDGEYSGNTENGSVLGIAYRNTSFVIFEATIKEFSQQVFAPSLTTLESTVIHHELGHLLGLVNNGTTPQSNHHDATNGAHCDVDGCLMYWQAETGEGILNMLSGGTIADLDAQCQADLQANGGK